MSGAVDASLILSSAGTAADALQITTTAGGMDITNGGAAGEDYGSWTGACGPSWSCRVSHPKDVSFLVLFGALGPGEHRDRLWSRRRGSNIIKIDGWPLPGPSGPTLWARHFWTPFGSLLGIRFRTHFWSIWEAVSGLMLELIRDSCWS